MPHRGIIEQMAERMHSVIKPGSRESRLRMLGLYFQELANQQQAGQPPHDGLPSSSFFTVDELRLLQELCFTNAGLDKHGNSIRSYSE